MNEEKLLYIIETLSKYHNSKEQLQIKYIEERLNKNLSVYYKKLSDSVRFLSQQSEKKVLKKLNVEQ